jgi:hypothetical protein
LEETLLASIIFGFCAPWSDLGDLGIAHLRGVRTLRGHLIDHLLLDGGSPETVYVNADHHFLLGCMAYWEACTSFVVDQPKTVIEYLYPFAQATKTTYIHMFAGISFPLFVTLARVGICVRQSRALRNMDALGWKDSDAHRIVAVEVLQDASELYRHTVDYSVPAEESFDTKDLASGVYRRMKAFAQICKFSILLELRKNFGGLTDVVTENASNVLDDAFHLTGGPDISRTYHDLSTAALSHARDIPEGSTCGLQQTLLLIICGSALRAYLSSTYAKASEASVQDRLQAQLLATLARQDEVEKQRAFVRRRLQTNASFGLGCVHARAEQLLEGL